MLMGAATWTLQKISTSCFRAHPRQSRSQLKIKKTTKGWIEMGHSQLHLQNKFEWYLPCENQFYLHEKRQCLPNQDFELTLILKNKGQLCQDDDCKECWEGPSAFPWRNSFSTISSPNKWNGWEQVYVLRPGWVREFTVAASLLQIGGWYARIWLKLTAMFLFHITQGFHMTIQHNMGVGCRRKLVFTRRNSPRMSITSTIGTNQEI